MRETSIVRRLVALRKGMGIGQGRFVFDAYNTIVATLASGNASLSSGAIGHDHLDI